MLDTPITLDFQSAYGLALEQFDGDELKALELRWLESKGLSFKSLWSPWPIGATNVRFDGHFFHRDPRGFRAFTFVCFDRGVPFDIAAWRPKTNQLATLLGQAFCLDQHDWVDTPSSTFGLTVHPNVLSWLQSDRDGITIIREDLAHAWRKIERLVMPPRPRARVFVPRENVA